MKINEIFKSISGEARYAGQQSVFIRTYGCNLRCAWCDTIYSYNDKSTVGGAKEYMEMTVDEVIEIVNSLDTNHIILTGGEPLLQPDATALVKELMLLGYTVEIETNGSIPFTSYQILGCSITLDYKCPSSKVEGDMLSVEEMCNLTNCDTLKFVLSATDFEAAKARITAMEEWYDRNGVPSFTRPTYYLSPVFGKVEPSDIVHFMLSELDFVQERIKFQLQIHKFVWDPNQRGV